MKTCHATATDRKFARDLHAVITRLIREGKPVPGAESRRPKSRASKSPRRPS